MLLCSSCMTASIIQLQTYGLDRGPLSPHIKPYISLLEEQGYKLDTLRVHLRVFSKLNRWLLRTGRCLSVLDETAIGQFTKAHLRRPQGWAGERRALLRLLGVLRRAKVAPPPKAVSPTPAQLLANRYRCYLLEERGCSQRTVENYARHIDRFVAHQFGTGPAKPSLLQANDLIEFVRRNALKHTPQHTKVVVTGLRSFMRFLQYSGEIDTDLASAVPAVAHWRLRSLPENRRVTSQLSTFHNVCSISLT